MKLVKETLYEAFTEESDPIRDMEIGQRAQIKKWFKTWAPDVKYEIDDELNIKVFGGLNLIGKPITEFPNILFVKGKLDLESTAITKLPDNLTVGGYLDLDGTKIRKLPDNLTVGEWLDITNTRIKKLPKTLKVKGEIYKDF